MHDMLRIEPNTRTQRRNGASLLSKGTENQAYQGGCCIQSQKTRTRRKRKKRYPVLAGNPPQNLWCSVRDTRNTAVEIPARVERSVPDVVDEIRVSLDTVAAWLRRVASPRVASRRVAVPCRAESEPTWIAERAPPSRGLAGPRHTTDSSQSADRPSGGLGSRRSSTNNG